MSGDPEQAYFSDGMAEDIITDLSKISGLFVIARNSAFAYRGRAIDLRHVARELGVGHVLEGSVRKAGNRVRITAQLIDGTTGGHLWAERYDRDLTDIFAVQDEVTQHIVSALSLKLTRDERQRLARKGTENVEAYDLFLRGRGLWWRMTREMVAESKPMFERAIALDEGFAAAHAGLAQCHNLEYINGWCESPEASQQQAYVLALKAVNKDPSDAQANVIFGAVLLWRKEHEPAIAAASKAVALESNYAYGYAMLGQMLHYAGRSAESLDHLARAMRLDPRYPGLYLHWLALSYYALGRYEDAVAALKRRLVRDPNTDISRVILAACYGQLGEIQAARAEWREALRINPTYSLERRKQILPYKDPADFEKILEGLRKAGLPG
jgi:adenylate cyclase